MTTPRSTHVFSERLHDVATVAARLDVSVKTVRRMIERGVLPAHRIGKLLRISETDLLEYLANVRSNSRDG